MQWTATSPESGLSSFRACLGDLSSANLEKNCLVLIARLAQRALPQPVQPTTEVERSADQLENRITLTVQRMFGTASVF